jgi:hypothetical protein
MNVIQQLQMQYHVFERDLITTSMNSLLGGFFSTWGDPQPHGAPSLKTGSKCLHRSANV